MVQRYLQAMALAMVAVGLLACPVSAQEQAEHMRLVAHNDLNGNGDGGEGMAIQQLSGGRRILYLAHEGQKTCLSILDVTEPRKPMLLNQLPSPGPGVTRCNSLGLAGNTLAVANQANGKGKNPAGFWLLDVSDVDRVQTARSLRDLALSFFDTSGPHSRGVHWLWFVDREFIHLSTGAADSNPTNALDDQFYMVVDVRDPRSPREVGRWWLPGTQAGDPCLPGCLPQRLPIDTGYRAHDVEVFPERPDRAYMGYVDGGMIILDISGVADVRQGRASRFAPRLVSRHRYAPPFPGFTHTVHPLFQRSLAIVSDESTKDKCADAPKLIWLVDIRVETNPVIVGTAPLPENAGALCARGGWFGAHNQHPNFPSSTSAQLRNTVVASFFNGGVRIYRLSDVPVTGAPPQVKEIGFFVPPAPPGNPTGTIQINHMIVDENGMIYANDRVTGGLYILQYTGPEPLD